MRRIGPEALSMIRKTPSTLAATSYAFFFVIFLSCITASCSCAYMAHP
jgi:hypothetical protein